MQFSFDYIVEANCRARNQIRTEQKEHGRLQGNTLTSGKRERETTEGHVEE